jgi:hypothetical protein
MFSSACKVCTLNNRVLPEIQPLITPAISGMLNDCAANPNFSFPLGRTALRGEERGGSDGEEGRYGTMRRLKRGWRKEKKRER